MISVKPHRNIEIPEKLGKSKLGLSPSDEGKKSV